MKKHLSRIIVGATLVFGGLIVALAGDSLVFAQSSTNNNTNTLKLSPVRSDIVVEPGKSKVVTIQVTNLTKSPMTVKPVQNDFIAGDDRGTPALILDEEEYAPTHSLKRFMAPLSNVTVAPESTQDIDLTINVPASAQAGGYYGAVRIVPVNPDGTAQVNLNASAASLVLLTVPGDLVERLDLTRFDVVQGEKADAWFQSANDLGVSFRFENQGNVQVGPYGTITVKQGDEVIFENEFNYEQPREVVLPDSAREWDIPLKNIGSIGYYEVTALFTYGTKNETIEVTKTFWVVPWAVIIGAVVGVLVLIGLIIGIVAFLKSYKRRILRGQRGMRRR